MTKKRIGRPTKKATPGQRASLGLRVRAEIKEKLDKAAEESGRSQSQEAELRLEQTFKAEQTASQIRRALRAEIEASFGGPRQMKMMHFLGALISRIEDLKGNTWEDDAATNELVISQFEQFFRQFGPEGSREAPLLNAFEQFAEIKGNEEKFDLLLESLTGKRKRKHTEEGETE